MVKHKVYTHDELRAGEFKVTLSNNNSKTAMFPLLKVRQIYKRRAKFKGMPNF